MKNLIYKLIQYFKMFFEVFYPGYYSENCRAIKRVLKNNDITLKVIYDVGCFKGQWYKQRKKTFPEAEYFYLFDAQNLISFDLLKDKAKFFNVVLGSIEGEQVSFWQDGGSGSSYFKEIGNTLWNNVEPEIVNTKTLKALIKENSLKKPNYLKIDTQSSEIEILKGLEEIINYESLYFIELEISLYQINEGAPTIKEVIDFMSMNNFLLISTEQLPIVEYFNEKKLVQLNGIFAQRKLITIS